MRPFKRRVEFDTTKVFIEGCNQHTHMKIVEIQPSDRDWREPWNRFVAENSDGFPLQAFDWQNVLQDCFTVRTRYALCVDKEEIRGLIPLYEQRSPVFGHSLDTFEGGILATTPEAGDLLTDYARRVLSGTGAQKLQFRGGHFAEISDASTEPRVHTVVDLAALDVWNELKSNLRRKIRKAKKEGALIKTTPFIPESFHNVYLENQRNLGTPEQGKAYFLAMNRHLKDHLMFHGVWIGDTLAAGIVSVGIGSRWLNLYVASSAKYRKMYVVNAAYWESISSKVKRGATSLDLGRSVENSGNHRFKQDWCGRDVYMNYVTISARIKSETKSTNSSEKTLAQLWKCIPLPIARLAGPLIRRGYPFS